jgi:hypothetical protein
MLALGSFSLFSGGIPFGLLVLFEAALILVLVEAVIVQRNAGPRSEAN